MIKILINLILVFIVLTFSKEAILLSEELTLIISFSIFFYNVYRIGQSVLSNVFIERAFDIKKNYLELYDKKIENLIFLKKLNIEHLKLDNLLLNLTITVHALKDFVEKRQQQSFLFLGNYVFHKHLVSLELLKMKQLLDLDTKSFRVSQNKLNIKK